MAVLQQYWVSCTYFYTHLPLITCMTLHTRLQLETSRDLALQAVVGQCLWHASWQEPPHALQKS